MSAEEMRRVAREFKDAMMRNDVEKLVSLFTEDATITDPAGTLKGHDGVRVYMKWMYSNFTKFEIREVGSMVEENRVATEYVLEGVTPESLTLSFPGVAIKEFKGLKVQHFRNYFDLLTAAKQAARGWMAKRAVASIDKAFRRGLR